MPKPSVQRSAARRRRPPEPVPIFSGRLLIAAGILAVMLIVPFTLARFMPQEAQPETTDVRSWNVGSTANVRITLITADFNLLSCAAPQAIEGKHCASKSENEPWPADPSAPIDDNKASIIQPFRTYPDNKLILVAGLWADPTMALRLHREPSAGVRPDKLARFVANCKVKFIGKLEAAKLRWNPGGPWQNEGPALVAQPIECKLTDQ